MNMAIGALLIAVAPGLRVILGAIFLTAAISKLHNPQNFLAAIRALGTERPILVPTIAFAVPLLEASLGVWLFTGVGPVASATAAVAAFASFSAVLFRLRQVGYTRSCGCFMGDRGAIGAWPIVRNGLLVFLAVCLFFGTYLSPSRSWWPSPDREYFTYLAVACVTIAGYIAATRKMVPVPWWTPADEGSTATLPTPLAMIDMTGHQVVLGESRGRRQLVLFAMGKCPGCRRDRDLVGELAPTVPSLEVVIVCGGNVNDTEAFAHPIKLPVRVVADPTWRVALSWQVVSTPFSVLINERGGVMARGPLASVLSLLGIRASRCETRVVIEVDPLVRTIANLLKRSNAVALKMLDQEKQIRRRSPKRAEQESLR